MLPHFPKTRKQITEIRDINFWEGYYSASPILAQIAARPQREGRQNSFQDEQGSIRTMDYKKRSITIRRKLEEARGLTDRKFAEAAREAGLAMGREVARGIYETVEKAAKEAGNLVNLGGRPLTSDLFLELLNKILMDFAPDGSPIWPTFSVGSDAQAQFQQQWPEWLKDRAFRTGLERIIERKKEQFYEREACRRLVE
jgi:hypothetical protein